MDGRAFEKVEAPTKLSYAEQVECTDRILEAINDKFDGDFSPDDVAPVKMSTWAHEEAGFVRGGAFNIRVRGSQYPSHRRKKIHPGRFTDPWTWITFGIHPSLHIPGKIDGATVFELDSERTLSAGGDPQIDFVAHIDSAYAYIPTGLLYHLLVDMAGADTRNPCPAER